jgi:predicted alpha/beta hydrolase family esterase
MPSEILVLHSSGPQGPGEGSEPFAARLGEELGSEYEVLFPELPAPDDPHYGPWSERIGQLLAERDAPPVVVGHSLGGSVFLKRLAETGREEPIAGLVLVAMPLWGRDQEWELEWALPEDWPRPETTLPRTFLFHSRDDEVIPFAHLDRYAALLPDASVHPLEGNGHLFDRGDLGEITAAIRSLSSG